MFESLQPYQYQQQDTDRFSLSELNAESGIVILMGILMSKSEISEHSPFHEKMVLIK